MFLKEFSDLITEHGFAVAIATFLTMTIVWYLRHLAKSSESAATILTKTIIDSLKRAREDLRTKDVTINNHLDHLTERVTETNSSIAQQITAVNNNFDKFIDAIHGQTAMMKEILSRPCPLSIRTPEELEEIELSLRKGKRK